MRRLLLSGIVCTGLLGTTAAPAVAGNPTYYHEYHHHSNAYYQRQREYEHERHERRVKKYESIGIGAAGGAVIGGLIGGGAGVAVGAVAGGGAGYLYNRHKQHEHH